MSAKEQVVRINEMQGTGEQIGSLAWWSQRGIAVDRAKLEQLAVKHGLSEKFLPPVPIASRAICSQRGSLLSSTVFPFGALPQHPSLRGLSWLCRFLAIVVRLIRRGSEARHLAPVLDLADVGHGFKQVGH